MMAAEEDLIVFQGVQHRGNTLVVLPKQATQKNGQITSDQRVAEITCRGLCWLRALLVRPFLRIRYGSLHGDARAKPSCRGLLLARSVLRIRYGFPQQPQCDLISASLEIVKC